MGRMIVPDRLFRVPIEGGELCLSPSYDFLNYFPFVGAYILKYFNQEAQPPALCDVMLSERSAKWLMDTCGIECLERKTMSVSEHDRWIEWSSMQLEAEYGAELADTDGDGDRL